MHPNRAELTIIRDRMMIDSHELHQLSEADRWIPPGTAVEAAGLPVEFHCHGIGRFDFSSMVAGGGDLVEWLTRIDGQAASERVMVVITLFIRSTELGDFERLVAAWSAERRARRLPHIVGFGVEGPMLASFGGTPKTGSWVPSVSEWNRLAELGPQGLIYTVISQGEGFTHGDYRAAVDNLCRHGIHPALGHFGGADVDQVLRSIDAALDAATRHGVEVLTDHLFNDMPRPFKHAWRGREARRSRLSDLLAAGDLRWTGDNLCDVVGPVAAKLIASACESSLTLCVNFDGEHVDAHVLRKLVGFVGADRIIAMTDRVDVPRLKNHPLATVPGSRLWYIDEKTVAASQSRIDDQISNMISDLRIDDVDVLKMTVINAQRFLPAIVREQWSDHWRTMLRVGVSR